MTRHTRSIGLVSSMALCAVVSASLVGLTATPTLALTKAEKREAVCRTVKPLSYREVCRDRHLTRRDAYLNQVYASLRRQTAKRDRPALVREQRAWVRDRNRCGTSYRCIDDAYTDRTAVLEHDLENLAFPNQSIE